MLSALASRDFRLLWISQTVSGIGDTLILVAIGLYVTRLTGNPTDVGLVLAAYSVPLVIFLLVGGVIADRLPRQKLMVATDIVRACAHGTLTVLILTGVIRIWMMIVIGVIFAIARAFFQPAYTGIVPQTVAESDIQGAQALGGLSREIASFVSPAVATVLVLTVGGAAAFGLDAASFVFSALLVWRIRLPDSIGPATETGMFGELRSGWSAVRERGWVLGTIIAFSFALPVGLAPFEVLGAQIAREVYHSEAVFGLANAAWGIGTITGAVIGSRWRPRRPMLVGMSAAVPWGAAVAVYASGAPVAVIYTAMAAAGICLGLFSVLWETALAERIPGGLLSRVSAWDWMGSLALLPIGYIFAGPLGHWLGDVDVLVGGGIAAAVATALGLLPRATRSLRALPAGVQAAVAEATG